MNTADDASMIFHISDSCVLLHQCYIPKIPEDADLEYVCFYSERDATTRMAAPCKEEQRSSG